MVFERIQFIEALTATYNM